MKAHTLSLLAVFIVLQSTAQDAATIMMNQQMNNSAGLMNIRNMQRSFDAQSDASKRATAPSATTARNARSATAHPATTNAGTPSAATNPGNQASAANSLSVTHDPAISKNLRNQYIANIAKTNGRDTAMATDKFFGDIQTTFGKMIAPFGLHADNYADVMAVYLVVMWMSINRQTQIPPVATVQAVRGQLLQTLTNSGITQLSGQQRQIVAETLMYQACSAVSMRERAVQKGDQQLLGKLAEQTSAILAKEGINLSKLTLTSTGFTKAR